MGSGILWPMEDIVSGAWSPAGSPVYDFLYQSLSNRCGIEDILCYASCPGASGGNGMTVKVQPAADPESHCCHYLQFFSRLNASDDITLGYNISGLGINDKLFSVDKTLNLTTTGWVTTTYELTASEAAQIEDYTDIHLFFENKSAILGDTDIYIGLAYFYIEYPCPGQKVTYTVPTGDISAGDWATAPLYSKINSGIIGGPADLGDFIDTIASPSTPFEVHLSGGPDASSDECHVLRYIASLDAYYGSENVDLDIGLYDGTTLIKEETKTLTSVSWVTGEMTLSAAEAANITNYQNLRVKGSGSDSAGGNTPRIAEIEFQYPYALDLTRQQWPAAYLHFV
jgi:hypothetical protein